MSLSAVSHPSDASADWICRPAVRKSNSRRKSRTRSGMRGALVRSCLWMSADEALLALQPAADCCALDTMLATPQPVRDRCWTCSRGRRAHARRHGLICWCIQRSGASCGTAHGSLRHLRLLTRLTRLCLARARGSLGTSIATLEGCHCQCYVVATLISPHRANVCGPWDLQQHD